MKNDPKYSQEVKIAKETAGTWSPKNLHARDNVNVAQGPRTGNAAAHDGKRGNFKAAKEERAPLADVVERAFGARAQRDAINSKLEPIRADSKEKYSKR